MVSEAKRAWEISTIPSGHVQVVQCGRRVASEGDRVRDEASRVSRGPDLTALYAS